MGDRLKELIEGAVISRRLAKTKNEWDEVERYYDVAIKIAVDFDLPKDVFFDYAQYLHEQRKITKAMDIIKKLHNYFDEISSIEKKAVFYQIAANLFIKVGNEIDEVIYCFNNAFSYWLDITNDAISEKQMLQLASLYVDIGHFWNKADLTVKNKLESIISDFKMDEKQMTEFEAMCHDLDLNNEESEQYLSQIGSAWNRTQMTWKKSDEINSPFRNEGIFAKAYALLWQTRKVLNNITKNTGRMIATSQNSFLTEFAKQRH